MSLFSEDGRLRAEGDAGMLRLIEIFKKHFEGDYILDMPDDFEWSVDQKIANDVRYLLMLRDEPEDFLGLFENGDAQKMTAVFDVICKLDEAIAALSIRARNHLADEEKMALSALTTRINRTVLHRDGVRRLADIVERANKYISASEKRGRSDKRWDAIAIANDCIKIWERQTGKRPYLSEKCPEKSEFAEFVIDIFGALQIKVDVGRVFKKLNAEDAPDLSGVPSYLRRPIE